MCGINGFNFVNEELIKKMNNMIKHRGPDDEGIYLNEKISLGQVRLAIIDITDAGHQPMYYSKETGACSLKHQPQNISQCKTTLVFNGEIYNFIDIRKELELNNYKFTTQSDSEVILAAYDMWGVDCVKQFNGVWAFCIYDEIKNILFLSRDRLGVKPLHYYYDDDKFIFSSEIKGIITHKEININYKKNISNDAVSLYFSLGYIPAPWTIYDNVYKLESSHNMIFDLSSNKILYNITYYELPKYNPIYNKKELIRKGKKLLEDATKIRMYSDVPVGAFLSGGLDSTTVVNEMCKFTNITKLHTFSIGFDGKYDESKYINIAKNYFKTNHHHEYFKQEDFDNLINNYIFTYDEPFSDYSGFPTIFLSKLAKKDVTVSLSGDGGDEIFGGYNIHLIGARMELLYKIPKLLRLIISQIPIKKNLGGFASFYLFKEACKLSLYQKEKFFSKVLLNESIKTKIHDEWTEERMKYCLNKGNGNLCEGLRIFDLLGNSLSDNFLVKVDRASMSEALEVRSPFLDYRFVEYSQTIPTKWKTNIKTTKIIMKEIIKSIIPNEIVKRKKQGFTPPIADWINNDKYIPYLIKAKNLLNTINPQIALFYNDKVLQSNNRLYDNYKIRLYLFYVWWEKWVI